MATVTARRLQGCAGWCAPCAGNRRSVAARSPLPPAAGSSSRLLFFLGLAAVLGWCGGLRARDGLAVGARRAVRSGARLAGLAAVGGRVAGFGGPPRALAVVGGVEARTPEMDGDRVHHPAQRAAALCARLEGIVAHLLKGLERGPALIAPVLVDVHAGVSCR